MVGRLGAGARLAGCLGGAGYWARRTDGRFGDAARGLAADNLVKVLAFRGATHLMTSGTRVRTWPCEPRAVGGQKMCHSAVCWHRVPVVAYGVNRRDVVGRE